MSGCWSLRTAARKRMGARHPAPPHFISTSRLDLPTYRLTVFPTPSLRTELRAPVSVPGAGVGEVHAADGVLPSERLRMAVPVAVVVGRPDREVHVRRAHESRAARSGDLAE